MPDLYIQKVTHNIDELLSLRPNEDDLLNFISNISPHLLFESCLRLIKDNRDYLTTVCRSSYAHPNGFTKLTLIDRTPAWALRLHIWHTSVLSEENDIHNHCGYLSSKVVHGELNNEVYEESDLACGSLHYCYQDVLENSRHTLSYIGMRSLQLQRCDVIHMPMAYYLDGEIIHRTTPTVLPLVTLVLQGPITKTASLVYRPKIREMFEVISTSCSEAFYIDSLKEALRYG